MRSRNLLSHAIASDETSSGSEGRSPELVLIRHATSMRAQLGMWGRQFDAPLASGFESELAETKAALWNLDKPIIISSPLARCRETAAFVFPEHPIHVIDEFKAYHSGQFENVTEAYVREQYPWYLERTFRDRFLEPGFGEESIGAQAGRVASGLAHALGAYQGTLVIVAHYSSINIIAHLVAGNFEPLTYADGTYNLRDGEFIRLPFNPSVVRANLAFVFGSNSITTNRK